MRKRKLLLRSKRPLPRRLKSSPLRKRRRDPKLLLPRIWTLLVSMALPELKSNPPEVEEVAVEVAVVTEVATEVDAVATEVAVAVTEEVAEVRDVDLDPKVKRVREDPDQKVDSVEAEAKELKVLKVKNAQDQKVDSVEAEVIELKELKVKNAHSVEAEVIELKELKVKNAQDPKVDSVVAEARELKVLKVSIVQEQKAAEAEDPPELRVKEPLSKVKSLYSAPEERELSVMVNTASRARRESSTIPLTEKMELAEAEVSLKAVLERATGEPQKKR